MVQKEVAERMTRADVRIAFDVPPSSFLPPPKVTSSVVVCDVRESPYKVSDEKFFIKVVRGAFGQRRKTLLNSLVGAGFNRPTVEKSLSVANIEGGRRAETLSIEEFTKLAEALKFSETKE